MNTYKLLIEYDGTNWHGWQIQRHHPSVQGAIEEALGVALGEKTSVIGSGRTDAGVHARGQVAHFCLSESTDPWKLRASLNGLLPRSIRILDIREVSNDFHARYSATKRTYEYHVATEPRALDAATRWVLRRRPDFDAMNLAAAQFLGEHDFSAFCRAKAETDNRVCEVVEASWRPEERHGDWVFRISADRFLHGMVRTIVGTLMLIGNEKLDRSGLAAILASKDRRQAGRAAPARGLVLHEVAYPTNV